MSPFSQEDEDLTRFLRRHRSDPPAASPDLEDQIIQALPRRKRFSRPLVMGVAGLAACVVGVIIAQPVRSPLTDATEIEAFMESSWSGTLETASTSETTSDDLAWVESTN